MRDATTGRLLVLATAVLFSTGGVAIKLCSLGALDTAGLRAALAALALVAFVRPPRTAFTRGAIAVGLCQAATMLLFVVANKLTTAAAAIFLQGTAPIWVALLSLTLLREPIRRGDVGRLLAYGVGLALLVAAPAEPLASAPDPARGNLAALASGVTWALVITGLRWLASRTASQAGAAAVAGNVTLAAVLLPWIVSAPPSIGRTDALALAWLGIVQVGLSYALLTVGMRRVRAFEASILLLAEPVLSTLWAWLVFAERPGPLALAGCAILLVAGALTIRGDAAADSR